MTPKFSAIVVMLLVTAPTLLAQKQYGFDNRKESAQAYLSPGETVAAMTVPPEFEVQLFAGEPEVVNPVAFSIDERGRVWVLECFEYPSRTPKGQKPRDRIVILEDTNGDGKSDKRIVFATGADFPVPPERAKQGLPAFDLATGLEVGHGKVFVGAPPYLWTIEITGENHNQAGKYEPVLSGFGSQDTHETLNTFTWGPDGYLYGMQGIFTESKVKPLDGDEMRMNAAVWRYHPVTKQFEIYAEGTSNPWGIDWRNTDGEFILACCVIPHLYHIVPGGIYRRQAGQSENLHVYDSIQEISDHTFHRESGWAHAGLLSLDVPHMPERFRKSVIFGSIHGCSLKQNILEPHKSSYIAKRGDDFLQSRDKNVRPINLKWGPHGDIYLIDWHDKNPCHQAAAESWDYSRGRVYRIQLKGRTGGKAPDLSQLSREQLIPIALAVPATDPWRQRSALRLFQESQQVGNDDFGKLNGDQQLAAFHMQRGTFSQVGEEYRQSVPKLARRDGNGRPDVRAHLARALGEYTGPKLDEVVKRLATEAGIEPNPVVRRDIAAAANRLASRADVTPIVHALLQNKQDADDPLIPHLTWLAYEKVLSKQSQAVSTLKTELAWLKSHAPGNEFVREQIVPKTLRRIVAFRDPKSMEMCLAFVEEMLRNDPATARAALDGLVIALDRQTLAPPAGWAKLQAALAASRDDKLLALAEKLAVSFRDPALAARSLVVAESKSESSEARVGAVRRLATLRPVGAAELLLKLATTAGPIPLRIEAVRALSNFPQPDFTAPLIARWDSYPSEVRAEVVTVLAARKPSALALITALKQGKIASSEVGESSIRKMQSFRDPALDKLIDTAWGRARNSPKELLATIDTTRDQLNTGHGDYSKGKAIFTTQCAKCHAFEGQGQAVGPALDGAGRDLEYLLANIIDPNRVVGAPYFLRTLTTLDGRVEQGVLYEENDEFITLKVENGLLKRVAKADLDGPVQVAEKSMMPEGLAYGMKPNEFRDLVSYLLLHPYLTFGTLNGKPLAAPVSGRIVLPQGQSRLEFPINAASSITTRLELDVAGSVQVTLDGQAIGATKSPGPNSIPVTIPAGSHMLTLSIDSTGGAFKARLIDPDRRLTPPVNAK